MKFFTQNIDEMDEFTDFLDEDLDNVQRVIEFCDENDVEASFEVHAKAETCKEAAENTDVDISQIVKTLIFKSGDEFVAVLASGDKRVSEDKLAEVTGREVRMATPEEVTEETSYVVGGVSPFDLDLDIYIDENVMESDLVRPAAGSRVVGASISSEELKDMCDGEVVDLT